MTELRVAVLKSEGTKKAVSTEDMAERQRLLRQISKSTIVVSKIRNFMPQVGCPNRCAFCSQNSAKMIVSLSERGLKNLISAIKSAAISASAAASGIAVDQLINEDGSLTRTYALPANGLIGHRSDGGKSAVYPYLDTDICSYRNLYQYVKYMHEDFGVPIVISTVGYSRHNRQLQEMHDRIVRDFPEAICSVTFSITPYTYGWTNAAARSGRFSRGDFNIDIANAIRTYAPLMQRLGVGRRTFCASLRFRPDIHTSGRQLHEGRISGHHFIHSGPHFLFSVNECSDLEQSKVIGIEGRDPVFDKAPYRYILVTSDSLREDDMLMTRAERIIANLEIVKNRDDAIVREVDVYNMINVDGPYYATDPIFKADGRFEALYIYAKSNSRLVSGYNNAERPLMNTILEFKNERGIGRHDEFPTATWADVEDVLGRITKMVDRVLHYDRGHAMHIRNEVLPLVESYIDALKHSGLGPSFFFHPHFTDDTGQIVNRGMAIAQFKGLAATIDVPMTPNEERTFNHEFHLIDAGYRISPVPANAGSVAELESTLNQGCVSFAHIEYNPTFRHTDSDKELRICGVETESTTVDEFYLMKLLPGIKEGQEST